MVWTELFIGGLIGLATSVSLIVLVLQASRRYGLPGRVGEAHHTHKTPIPRIGGIALAGAMVAVLLFFFFLSGPDFLRSNERWLVIPASLAMFALGLWDDLFGLGAKRKLIGQLFIAIATFYCGIGIFQFKIPITYEIIDLGHWAGPVTVIWLVAMTNLINLIDGIDGLAGGICLMLMVLLMYVSLQADLVPVVAAGMAGALLGFLRFNFPPARIYMGDGGAYFLGFFIGCSTIVTSHKGTIVTALMAPLFVLALPIIDTSVAILRRGLKGLPLFRPDRKHIHHRLLALGHSRRRVVLGLYAFTAFFLLLGFSTFCWRGQYFPVCLGTGVLIILLAAGKFSFSREWFSVGGVLGNSFEARTDIQYAICLCRWLALEGKRAQTQEDLAEDVVFIARKLGFASVRIRLEDEEKTWSLIAIAKENCDVYKHPLPGQKYCFLELSVGRPELQTSPTPGVSISTHSISDILADLLAEGWIKAIGDWTKLHQLPVRFDARPKVPAVGETVLPNTIQSRAETPPLDL